MRVVVQPKFVNMPQLFFRQKSSSEMDSDSQVTSGVRGGIPHSLSQPSNWNTKRKSVTENTLGTCEHKLS